MRNPTSLILATRHDPLMLKMVLSSDLEGCAMTQFSTQQDGSFPYVLLYSTFGTILSLAATLIVSVHSFAPMVA